MLVIADIPVDPPESLPKCTVEVVLDGVICSGFNMELPSWQQLGNLSPTISILVVQLEQPFFLLFTPGVVTDVGIKAVVPPTFVSEGVPFPALFGASATDPILFFERARDGAPLLNLPHGHHFLEDSIFLRFAKCIPTLTRFCVRRGRALPLPSCLFSLAVVNIISLIRRFAGHFERLFM